MGKEKGMPSLRATARHQAIENALRRNGNVGVSELAEQLKVSAVTVREDLKYLEGLGKLKRARGGAVAISAQGVERPLELTSRIRTAEKRAIGRAGAALVRNGQTVILDVGSTATELAKALDPSLTGVTVITNGLNIALILESLPGVTVVVTGGTLRPLQHSLTAPFGTLILKRLNADIAFLGCNGVDVAKGFTNANMAEAEIKQVMLDSAARSVFLADHGKLGRAASAFVASLEEADMLLTDAGAPPDQLEALAGAGLDVTAVPVDA